MLHLETILENSLLVRAESEQIVSTSASSNAGGIIISIRVSPWTSSFEDLGICCWLASLWVPKATCATIPWRVEGKASTFACQNSPVVMGSHLKPDWTHGVQITHTSSRLTLSRASKRGEGDSKIVAINKANIIEILFISKGYLSKSSRRGPTKSVAEQSTTTVPSSTSTLAGSTKGASIPTPDAAGPPCRENQGVGFLRW